MKCPRLVIIASVGGIAFCHHISPFDHWRLRMTNLQERRKRSGMSQFLLAQESGIPRMRISLAETGQINLTEEEESAVRAALNEK
jgi:DNA-binding XRE family transcriptional regulator